MAKTVACIIARTASTRLPSKVLRHVYEGCGMLEYIIERAKTVSLLDEIYVCTSCEASDDIIEDICASKKIQVYRGSADAVIERIVAVGEMECADNVVRITGDNVFTAFEYLERQLGIHIENGLDYTRLVGLPVGASAEIMRLDAVKSCYERIDPEVSEYLLLYMFESTLYDCGVVTVRSLDNLCDMTLTVDTFDDLERTRRILSLYPGDKMGIMLSDIVDIIKANKLERGFIEGDALIKMPYNSTVTYNDFCADMAARASKARQFEIDVRLGKGG